MAERKGIHVVTHGDGWATRREGDDDVLATFETQEEAIDAGREVAKRDQVEFYIHGRDGQIRARDSYGNDPFPPSG